MNEEELTRKLNSVGKKVFVENYETFKHFAIGRISRESAVDVLVCKGVSNDAGAAIRLGNAKQIFKANKQKEALEIICNSQRVPRQSLAEAERILLSLA